MRSTSQATRAIGATLLAAAALSAAPVHAERAAERALVSKLKYTNFGGYVADFRAEYKVDVGGKKITCSLKPMKHVTVAVGESVSIDLTGGNWRVANKRQDVCLDENGKIPLRVEVWGRIGISGGPNQNCRKDKRLYYSPAGGTMAYQSRGTTAQKNRCRVQQWPA